MKMTATGYNQHGEAIAIHEGKVFYIPGLIRGEEAEVQITHEAEKWGKATIVEILKESPNRVKVDVPNWLEIGGYELLHMNREEQTWFKESKIKSDFKMNAQTEIELEPMYDEGPQFRYRNKITLHDGAFYKKGTNEPIHLDDFLLTDIKPTTNKAGEIVIRRLATTIAGIKSEKKYTWDKSMGLEFRVSLGAFYQVNKHVSEKAYEEMLNFLDKDKEVLDLYSGIGTITLHAAKKSKHVTGVEWTKASHRDALHNMELNGMTNVDFVNMDVKKYMKRTEVKPDVVIVDPAREGLRKDVCQSIKDLAPERIIYLSCNPATQAADYNRLKDEYEIVHAKGFDMFPQTYHIENLIILDRRK